METKSFPIANVLTIVTGRLLCEMGGIYEILNWMTSESLYTHQLPRVGREAKPVLLAAFPQLQDASEAAVVVTHENHLEWLAFWKGKYGEALDVPKMTQNEHERIDPISEAAEHFRPEQTIVIKV